MADLHLENMSNVFGDEAPATPTTVEFCTDCLLARWGFGDGDMLDWLLEHGVSDARAVLCEVVRRKVLPVIGAQVEIEYFNTHNPIRAGSVNGVEIEKLREQLAGSRASFFTPASVIVTGEEILAIADEMGAPRG